MHFQGKSRYTISLINPFSFPISFLPLNIVWNIINAILLCVSQLYIQCLVSLQILLETFAGELFLSRNSILFAKNIKYSLVKLHTRLSNLQLQSSSFSSSEKRTKSYNFVRKISRFPAAWIFRALPFFPFPARDARAISFHLALRVRTTRATPGQLL